MKFIFQALIKLITKPMINLSLTCILSNTIVHHKSIREQ